MQVLRRQHVVKSTAQPRGASIQLGLKRVLKLFPPRKINWNAVHVAGTNGKGTVCFYLSHMLREKSLNVGRFTSPHLVDRWDCINIDGKPVGEGLFKNVERHYRRKNDAEDIGASPFEILTATAFDLFCMHKVDVGVIEVGVGGLEDATNILPQEAMLCGVITKIGLDHQGLLGETIGEIAAHKAGIIKPLMPVVYDDSGVIETRDAVRNAIQRRAADPLPTPTDWTPVCKIRNGREHAFVVNSKTGNLLFPLSSEYFYRHNMQERWTGPWGDGFIPDGWATNIALAGTAAQITLQRLHRPYADVDELAESVSGRQWPGRCQSLSLQPLLERRNPVLLDGAHNKDSAKRLGKFLAWTFPAGSKEQLRRKSVTWIIAASAGKDTLAMLEQFLQAEDTVFTVEFGPVDGMPWVNPVSAKTLFEEASTVSNLSPASGVASSVEDALQKAVQEAKEGPLVISGSLYLVSDVLRLLRTSLDEPPDVWMEKWEEHVKFDRKLWYREAGLDEEESVLEEEDSSSAIAQDDNPENRLP